MTDAYVMSDVVKAVMVAQNRAGGSGYRAQARKRIVRHMMMRRMVDDVRCRRVVIVIILIALRRAHSRNEIL